VALDVQHVFYTDFLRVYTSPDHTGVELGGAVKNPLAIAAGMVAGLELGHNTLAALITRGLAEMTRLSLARGGQMATLSGLAGLGDLVLTCTGELSRNRTVGFRLGRGETISQISSSQKTVAEGVHNTKTVLELSQTAGVEMPIIKAVYQVIYEGKSPLTALQELMTRDLKPEQY
jgi:glycerol-3-phosphate dehydrogenase (NAD(P)+)